MKKHSYALGVLLSLITITPNLVKANITNIPYNHNNNLNINHHDLDLPDIGTVASATLSIAQEVAYGDSYMRIIRATAPIVDDPTINYYLSNIGQRLVTNANDVKTPFNFFMIANKDINAFAFFGGYIALHSGLFLHTQSESELASVMAHEIAHVTQRHLARNMQAQSQRNTTAMASLAGAILLSLASPQAGIAAITATTAGSVQNQINYTRSHEKEADRFAISTLAKANFNVHAMPEFFMRLADETRYASKLPPMLLTHPLPDDRISDSRSRAQAFPVLNIPSSLEYYLTQSRVIARYLSMDENASLNLFAHMKKTANKTQLTALDYGIALVDLDHNKLDSAQKKLQYLIKHDPHNLFYIDALSDVYIAQNKEKQAIAMLKKQLTIIPKNNILIINYANALIADKQYQTAISELQHYTYEHPNDTNGWLLLAKANAAIGNYSQELASRAELEALHANWLEAIANYKKAASTQDKLDRLTKERYEARIKQLITLQEQFTAI